MGCSNFDDKYQECEFLIDEFKLIIFQSSSNQYTENEKLALDKYTINLFFKYEKEEKIRNFIDELEKNSTDEIQKRKILKLKNDFNDILDEDDNSNVNKSNAVGNLID